jgi:hypothetical protein
MSVFSGSFFYFFKETIGAKRENLLLHNYVIAAKNSNPFRERTQHYKYSEDIKKSKLVRNHRFKRFRSKTPLRKK